MGLTSGSVPRQERKLSKSSQIHSIDIGNDGSAFVEILVGKATAAVDTDFEVLLVASSFMTPLESRNGTNRTGVRMFGQDKLNKLTAAQKWDRVKIVCTQPFSKTSQYGLSFVKFHSPPSAGDSEPKVKRFGAFSVRESGEEDIPVGSLFANRSKLSSVDAPPTPNGAAAMRAATRLADEQLKNKPSSSTPSLSSTPVTKDEPRKRPAASSPPHSSKSKVAKSSKDESDTEEEEEEPQKPALKKQSTSLSSVSSSASAAKPEKSAMKRTKTEPAAPSPARSFSKMMAGVTFVLSGFQNPYRGQLRDQALEMGAKYKPDWGRGCTHLVCAFPNTPKYQQVAGKGKIVNKAWVVDSYKKKELQPWRRYRLGDAESPDESSEDEEKEDQSRGRKPQRRDSPPPRTEEKRPTQSSLEDRPAARKKTPPKKVAVSFEDSDSGGDTEDELRKAREIATKQKMSAENDGGNAAGKDNVYGGSTDEDEPGPSGAGAKHDGDDGSDSGLPDLPEFFTDKHFFLYGDFPSGEQRLLTRYIAAYNGEVDDYMSKRVNYVITGQKWDDNFEEALNENANLVFVKPKWIFSCHEKLKLLPYQPYIVVPQ
ncbi:DNA repair protein XRCC1 isoform X2 [Aplysia californica]|uniref:DNA repair protein XRCC1 isoform X2 n=1 Tax=Aplysia californica TaxID=6500 RepID=A0ABM1VTJ9_APLCA|nr:DNA repair protein XRCC1 isoform X2 [Aplysia californica]